MVDRGRFNDDCQVAARPDGNGVADDLFPEDLLILYVQPEPVVLNVLIPVFQLDHQVDRMAVFHTFNSEKAFNIDDPDPAKLNEMLCDLRRFTDQHMIADAADLHDIITDKPVSAAYQFQGCLTLADPTFSGDQHTFAVNIDQYPVDGNIRSQFHTHPTDDFRRER